MIRGFVMTNRVNVTVMLDQVLEEGTILRVEMNAVNESKGTNTLFFYI